MAEEIMLPCEHAQHKVRTENSGAGYYPTEIVFEKASANPRHPGSLGVSSIYQLAVWCGISFFAFILVGGSGCLENRPVQQFSWSIAEAKKRGTFVSEVAISPKSLTFAKNEITFEAAWLERRPDGDYAMCFRIEKGKEVFKGVGREWHQVSDKCLLFQGLENDNSCWLNNDLLSE